MFLENVCAWHEFCGCSASRTNARNLFKVIDLVGVDIGVLYDNDLIKSIIIFFLTSLYSNNYALKIAKKYKYLIKD